MPRKTSTAVFHARCLCTCSCLGHTLHKRCCAGCAVALNHALGFVFILAMQRIGHVAVRLGQAPAPDPAPGKVGRALGGAPAIAGQAQMLKRRAVNPTLVVRVDVVLYLPALWIIAWHALKQDGVAIDIAPGRAEQRRARHPDMTVDGVGWFSIHPTHAPVPQLELLVFTNNIDSLKCFRQARVRAQRHGERFGFVGGCCQCLRHGRVVQQPR